MVILHGGSTVLQFNIIELFLFFMVVAGATKAASFFAAAGMQLTMAERRAAIFKAITTQAIVLGVFAVFGSNILKFFHVSTAALEIAGGLILLIFAISLVLGKSSGDKDDQATGDFAIYPLAVPLLATPQAIVAIVVIFARSPNMAASINGYIALAMVIAANLVTMLVVAKMMGAGGETAKKGSGVAEVLLRIIAILLAALAVELIVLGLREYGIIAAAVTAAH